MLVLYTIQRILCYSPYI